MKWMGIKTDVVYTTGAYLQRMFIESLNEYRWVVTGFEDDTFYDGDYIAVNVSGNTLSDLIREVED